MATEIDESFKLAHETALKWFEIHAGQRLQMIRFFLLASAFLIAGYVTALQAEYALLASILSILVVAFAICFKQLDRRTGQLVKIGENYLRHSGAILAKRVGNSAANVAALAEEKDDVPSYRQTFNVVFWFVGLLGTFGLVAAWL